MYKDKKVIHIVCTGKNGEIGYKNNLLFSLPPDMKFFREQTLGNVVMMGRKTIESLPSPLDRRIVLKVSNQEYAYSNLKVSLSDAEEYSDLLNTDKIFIAGGSQLYSSTFDITDELWITEVANDVITVILGIRFQKMISQCLNIQIGWIIQTL